MTMYLVEEHQYSYDGGSEEITFHVVVDNENDFRDAFYQAARCKRGGFQVSHTELSEVIPDYLWACGEHPHLYEVRKLGELRFSDEVIDRNAWERLRDWIRDVDPFFDQYSTVLYKMDALEEKYGR